LRQVYWRQYFFTSWGSSDKFLIIIPHLQTLISKNHKSIFDLNNTIYSAARVLFETPNDLDALPINQDIHQLSTHRSNQYFVVVGYVGVNVSVSRRRVGWKWSLVLFPIVYLELVIVFEQKHKGFFSVYFDQEAVVYFYIVVLRVSVLYALRRGLGVPWLFVRQLAASYQKLADHVWRNKPKLIAIQIDSVYLVSSQISITVKQYLPIDSTC